jgi:hypothetical protein
MAIVSGGAPPQCTVVAQATVPASQAQAVYIADTAANVARFWALRGLNREQ